MDHPVKATHAVAALDAYTLHHDVVAIFTVVVGVVALAVQDVVANDWAIEEQLRVVTSYSVESLTTLDPVVAFATKHDIRCTATSQEVVAFTGKHLGGIDYSKHGILACPAKINIQACAVDDHVIAPLAPQEVVAKGVNNDVITITTKDLVGSHAGIEIVISAITPKGIVALVSVDGIVALAATQHHVFSTGKADHAGVLALQAVGPTDLALRRGIRYPTQREREER